MLRISSIGNLLLHLSKKEENIQDKIIKNTKNDNLVKKAKSSLTPIKGLQIIRDPYEIAMGIS